MYVYPHMCVCVPYVRMSVCAFVCPCFQTFKDCIFIMIDRHVVS